MENLEESHRRHQEMDLGPEALKCLARGKPRFYFLRDPDGYMVKVVRTSPKEAEGLLIPAGQVGIVHEDLPIGASGGDHGINVFLRPDNDVEQIGLRLVRQHPFERCLQAFLVSSRAPP